MVLNMRNFSNPLLCNKLYRSNDKSGGGATSSVEQFSEYRNLLRSQQDGSSEHDLINGSGGGLLNSQKLASESQHVKL